LSELQAIATMCDDGTVRPERVSARLESAAMVFAGELRAIHDLLYRPQRAPAEPVLEAILAALAGAFRELTELLACLPTTFVRSTTLDGSLRIMARLADEICGECVPHADAPALPMWMDRVQEAARRVAWVHFSFRRATRYAAPGGVHAVRDGGQHPGHPPGEADADAFP